MGVLAELHAQPRIEQARGEGHVGLQPEVKHRVKLAGELEAGAAQHDDIALRQRAVILALPLVVVLRVHKPVNLQVVAELPVPRALGLGRERVGLRLRRGLIRQTKRQQQQK